MTAREMYELIGKLAEYSPSGNTVFRVKITDIKQSYGNTRVQITPVAGSGSQWVEITSVFFVDE